MSKIRASHIVGFCALSQPLDTAEAEIKTHPLRIENYRTLSPKGLEHIRK